MWTITRLAACAALAASFYPLTLFLLASSPDGKTAAAVAAALAAAGLCAAAARLLPVPRLLAAAAIVWLAVALYASGPPAALAFVLYAAAAVALGDLMVARIEAVTPIERALLAYLCGVALLVAAASLVLHLPVHHAAVYAGACLAICLWRVPALAALARACAAQGGEILRARWGVATGAVALVAAAAWSFSALGVLTPIVAHDDLAYHLRMPYELLVRHRYSFDVVQHIWAAAPWAGDLAFAVPFVISQGAEGVKVWLAASYHLAGAVLLLGLLRRHLALAPALLFLAGYLSIPLALAANHTLHTEGISAALVLGIFALWSAQRMTPTAAGAIAAAVLLGLLGAVKSSNLVACLCLGLLWLPSFWRQARARPAMGLAILAGLATVLIPYATSWVRTGNPVLPLFNAVFKSPYFEPANFTNSLFTGMFGPGLFASLFLAGPRHLETGLATAAGLAVFFLLLPALIVLAWRGDAQRRAALVVALAFSLIVLSAQQYVRYIFPAMGLAVLAASALWDAPVAEAGTRWQRAWLAWWAALLLLATAQGMYAMPAVTSQTEFKGILRSLQPGGREAYLRAHAPERILNQAINQDMGRHAVAFYQNESFGAELYGQPGYASWYNAPLLFDFLTVKDKAGAAEFVKRHGITHILPGRTSNPIPERARVAAQALTEYAQANGKVIGLAGEASVIAFDDDLVWRRVLWQIDAARAGTPVAMRNAISEGNEVRPGEPLLVEVEGTCDSPTARVAIDLIWLRGSKGLGSQGSIQPCVVDAAHPDGRFSIRLRAEAPWRATAFRLWLGALGEQPVRYQVARVRTLGSRAPIAAAP